MRDDIAILAARVRGATNRDLGQRGQDAHAPDSEVTITATPDGLRTSS